MAVTLKKIFTVKPAVQTWRGKMPLSELDQTGIVAHLPTIYFYTPNKPEKSSYIIDTLILSLSKTLVHFYPLSGRLCPLGFGRLELDCNEMGVRFIEAESERNLDCFGEFSFSSEFKHLVPKVDYGVPMNEQPLLYVQFTRFKCGGFCLGLSLSHVVADGQAALHFVSEWARICRGEALGAPPFLDRRVVIDLADKWCSKSCKRFDRSEFDRPPITVGSSYDVEEPKKNTTIALFKLSKKQVEALKRMANQGKSSHDGYKPYTRYETITAHIWKCLCKARKHQHNKLVAVGMTVDSRKRMQPPLPDRYFGNATVDVIAKCNSDDLISKPLNHATIKIREAITKVTDEYVREAVTFLKNEKNLTRFQDLHAIRSEEGHFYSNPNMGVVSWLTLPLYDMDFGWGKEMFMAPGTLDFDGDSLMLRGRNRNGDGVVVALCLQRKHVEDFEYYFYKDIEI